MDGWSEPQYSTLFEERIVRCKQSSHNSYGREIQWYIRWEISIGMRSFSMVSKANIWEFMSKVDNIIPSGKIHGGFVVFVISSKLLIYLGRNKVVYTS